MIPDFEVREFNRHRTFTYEPKLGKTKSIRGLSQLYAYIDETKNWWHARPDLPRVDVPERDIESERPGKVPPCTK